MSAPNNIKVSVIPGLRYRDAPAAIEWLCNNLGFTKHLVVPDGEGGIAHAQLTLGNGMIMLGSVNDNEFGKLMRQPDECGGGETQSSYLVVENVDAIYEKVKAAGGEIVVEINDPEYGGRGFSCRDLEGHIWSLGTYNPWH